MCVFFFVCVWGNINKARDKTIDFYLIKKITQRSILSSARAHAHSQSLSKLVLSEFYTTRFECVCLFVCVCVWQIFYCLLVMSLINFVFFFYWCCFFANAEMDLLDFCFLYHWYYFPSVCFAVSVSLQFNSFYIV